MDKHTEKSVHGGDVYRNQVELDFSVNINPFGMPDGVKKALGDAIFLCISISRLKKFQSLVKQWRKSLMCRRNVFYLEMVHQSFLWRLSMQEMPKTVLVLAPSFSGYEHSAACEDCQVCYYYLKKRR